MKKFKLFLIITLTLTAFLGGYLLVKGDLEFSSLANKTGTILDKFGESQQPTTNNQGSASENSLFLISGRQVISPTNSLGKNSVLYHDMNTGKVYEYSLADKTEIAIYEKTIPGLISSIWSPEKNEFISAVNSELGYKLWYFDLTNYKNQEFTPSVKTAAFSPDGDYIAYYSIGNTTDETSGQPGLPSGEIIISQPDGSFPKTVLNTRIKDPGIIWPAKDVIILTTPDKGIFILNRDSKLQKFIEPLALFEQVWSRSGQKVLYSGLKDSNAPQSTLWVKDAQPQTSQYLEIEGSASKCVWSIDDTSVYCALAHSPSADNIYVIDTDNSSKKLIAELETPIEELFLSTTEDYLIFVSAEDNKLYGLRLGE